MLDANVSAIKVSDFAEESMSSEKWSFKQRERGNWKTTRRVFAGFSFFVFDWKSSFQAKFPLTFYDSHQFKHHFELIHLRSRLEAFCPSFKLAFRYIDVGNRALRRASVDRAVIGNVIGFSYDLFAQSLAIAPCGHVNLNRDKLIFALWQKNGRTKFSVSSLCSWKFPSHGIFNLFSFHKLQGADVHSMLSRVHHEWWKRKTRELKKHLTHNNCNHTRGNGRCCLCSI